MKSIAIILTGDPRHLDFCLEWWQNLVDKSTYNITFYSNTYYSDDIEKLHKLPDNAKHKNYTKGKALWGSVMTTSPQQVLTKEYLCSPVLKQYLNNPHESYLGHNVTFDYYFGRLFMLNNILSLHRDNIAKSDVILHARWDCAIRNTNFLQDFVQSAWNNKAYVFTGVQNEKHGLLHTNDWLYAGLTSDFIKDYNAHSIKNHIELFNKFYAENEVKAKSYLIGHNFYSTFLQHIGANINYCGCDSTLIREAQLKISDNFDDTWGKMLQKYLKSVQHRA